MTEEAWLRGRRRQLDKLRNKINNITRRELETFARSLSRRPKKRGKEKNFVSDLLPDKPPISIPHQAKPYKTTANNILDALEGDIFDLENRIELPKGGNHVPGRIS